MMSTIIQNRIDLIKSHRYEVLNLGLNCEDSDNNSPDTSGGGTKPRLNRNYLLFKTIV